MKIAVATGAGGLDDVVSTVFARATTFTIVDVENGEIKNTKVMQNPAAAAGGGAGIQAAQILVNEGVSAVIAGNFGPNASGLLAQTGVAMISSPGVKVEDAVKSAERGGAAASPGVQTQSQPYAPAAPAYAPGYGMGYGGGYGRGMGMGYGRGRGRGMGYGAWYGMGYGVPYGGPPMPVQAYPPLSKEDEIRALEEEKKEIERRLKELKEEK
jgi:predicted Fe-Mo cluster-binding NifX family protein